MRALLMLLTLAAAGGWASITVDDLPDYVVARRPVTLTFTIRQHGVRPLTGLSPTVEARMGNLTATAAATPLGEPGGGRYSAALTVADTGEWTITINSGFGNSRARLAPIRAIAAGAAALGPLADAERGRRLFLAKGCATCHAYKGLSENSIAVGPELTEMRLAPEFLTRFLADPAAVIPPKPNGYGMPNLGLKPAEIAALVAFLNGGRQATGE
jgi:mono/diheme cytochrome c family protein